MTVNPACGYSIFSGLKQDFLSYSLRLSQFWDHYGTLLKKVIFDEEILHISFAGKHIALTLPNGFLITDKYSDQVHTRLLWMIVLWEAEGGRDLEGGTNVEGGKKREEKRLCD
jgi:hypothetical protein